MICPSCHTENRDTAKFCDECGTRLHAPEEGMSLEAEQVQDENQAADLGESAGQTDGGDEAADSAEAGEVAEAMAADAGEQDGASSDEGDGSADTDAAANSADDAAADSELTDDADDQADPADSDPNGVEAEGEAGESADAEDASADANADAAAVPDPADEPLDLEALRNPDGVSLADEFDFRDVTEVDELEPEADDPDPAYLKETLPDPSRPRRRHPHTMSAADTTEIPVVGAPQDMLVDVHSLPESAWKPSDTLEMPAINVADEPANRAFIAPDAGTKEARKAEKQRRKEQKRAAREDRKNSSVDSHGRPRVPWSAGKKVGVTLLILALAGGGAAAATYNMQLWGGKSVPSVEGLSEADAIYLLQSEGFQIESDEVPSDDVEGIVLMSDPASGSRVDEGSQVMLHISVSRTIPKVKGMSEKKALAALKEAGYENIIDPKTEKRDDSEGKVLDVSPKAGSKAKSSAEVQLTLSEYYRVPDVKGKSKEQALTELDKAGYNAVVKMQTSKDVEPGKVISTKPAAKKRLKSGSTVTVNVSISREEQLLQAARNYLAIGSSVELKSASYVITSVDELTVHGTNQVYFTISGKPFTEFLGQTLYLPVRAGTGILTFEDNGTDVIAVD
ncbi:MAG: PASTA domain-containing protein [Coriobacteriia bacterium]|nr:PASTA domain-containing protein [Coriobacteriia bacterium]